MSRPPAPDQDQRDLAIHSRGKNVLVDAGAGTGKTTLVVERLVELLAPRDGGPALELSRIAAVTFTRKAAGELRLRIRQALLSALAQPTQTRLRRSRLAASLGALDTAHVGTIHGFADRLLRLHPMEARIGPDVEVVEDEAELAREATALLLHSAESGTVGAELDGWCSAEEAQAGELGMRAAIASHVRWETKEHGWGVWPGLDALFASFISIRDVEPLPRVPEAANLASFRDRARELAELARTVRNDAPGSVLLREAAATVEQLASEDDPAVIFRELSHAFRPLKKNLKQADDFGKDKAAWDAWRAFNGDTRREPVRATPLRDDLLGPLQRWLAGRLVAARPALLAAYHKVKTRRRAVDQLDLLLQLRNLLRDDRRVRGELQGRFDHLFVDEFQDTDPLQAEVVLYLAEQAPIAASWREIAVAPGKLTLVGDPKQSIYRFRRADIATYAAVRELVERGPCEKVRLSANFRCAPGIVKLVNERFDAILGTTAGGKPVFDPERGTVANEPLAAGRSEPTGKAVVVLPIVRAEEEKVDDTRASEARALASWLRFTVEGGQRQVVDPVTRAIRPAGYGDVAILASSTYAADPLFAALDRLDVPFATRGGKLFLSNALHRGFVLALRAVADRDDGVAAAALLRPPYFALDLDDLARHRAATATGASIPDDDGIRRVRAALALVTELRKKRLERTPGATARDLLERTGLGRMIALGPNGAQRLSRLRELCHQLDALAQAERLDFDAVTARARSWALEPVQLDPPRPVGGKAVQFLTTHQAKGLEFPIVILWDACGQWDGKAPKACWAVERDGASWAVDIDGLEWEEPAGANVLKREKRYLEAERRRLAYVAATRARDLLVLPVASPPSPSFVTSTLAAAPPELLEVLEAFDPAAPPAWGAMAPAPEPGPPASAAELSATVEARWAEAAAAAERPLFSPVGVSTEAHRAVEELQRGEDDGERPARKDRPGRFGPVFGETVHLAVGQALRHPALSPAQAVARAAEATGLDAHQASAAEDVARALAALADEGLRRAPGEGLQLEYPVALAQGGKLLGGSIDLVAAADGLATVIDFKTDVPPAGDVHDSHPDYVEQVRTYARMLLELGVARQVRSGLLFTADGAIRWA